MDQIDGRNNNEDPIIALLYYLQHLWRRSRSQHPRAAIKYLNNVL